MQCEATVGCVSGRAGVGLEVAKLNQIEKKYGVLLGQYQTGDKRRARFAITLTELARQYEATLNASHASWGKKRADLLAIYAKAQRIVTELENVIPTETAVGFVAELRGLQLAPAKPGRIDVSARLTGHADRLEQALGSFGASQVVLSPFPAPPGIAAGWERLDKTWPLAVLAYLLECAVIYIWFIVYREYRALQDWFASKPAAQPDDGR